MRATNRAYWDVNYFCVARAEKSAAGITYTDGAEAWDLIGVSVTPSVASAPHTSRNGGRITRQIVMGADMSINHEPETLERQAMLFGHVLGEDGELAVGINARPQPVGVGYYRALNDDTFEGVFHPYVRFSEGTEEMNAALDGITYTTKTTTGSCEVDDAENYEYRKSFKTKAEAIAWINEKLNIAAA